MRLRLLYRRTQHSSRRSGTRADKANEIKCALSRSFFQAQVVLKPDDPLKRVDKRLLVLPFFEMFREPFPDRAKLVRVGMDAKKWGGAVPPLLENDLAQFPFPGVDREILELGPRKELQRIDAHAVALDREFQGRGKASAPGKQKGGGDADEDGEEIISLPQREQRNCRRERDHAQVPQIALLPVFELGGVPVEIVFFGMFFHAGVGIDSLRALVDDVRTFFRREPGARTLLERLTALPTMDSPTGRAA